MADETEEQLKNLQIDDVKKSIFESDQIPITVGTKKQLVPRDTFINERYPANDITRFLMSEKDFTPQFGFIPIPEADQDSFDAFVDFLELRDDLMLPSDSEALEAVLKLAHDLHCEELVVRCQEQKIVNKSNLNPVVLAKTIDKQFYETTKRPYVVLEMNFHCSYERTNTAAVKHIRLFFKLGQELSRLFLFIFDPDSGSQGMQWVFYPPNDGDRRILDFYKEPDRSKDDWDKGMVALRDPGQASETLDNYLKTIPEMFISLLSQMKLRSTEKEFLNAEWWYDMIDECN